MRINISYLILNITKRLERRVEAPYTLIYKHTIAHTFTPGTTTELRILGNKTTCHKMQENFELGQLKLLGKTPEIFHLTLKKIEKGTNFHFCMVTIKIMKNF